MKNLLTLICTVVLGFIFLPGCEREVETNNNNEVIWFTYPAKYWNSQALHLGNGYMGASFYGGVDEEVFSLTEKSIWAGKPAMGQWEEAGVNPNSIGSLESIRRLIFEGNIKEADELITKDYLGVNDNFGYFSSIGDLYIRFEPHKNEAMSYIRSLDLSESMGSVSYQVDDAHYSREYFCSYPDRVLAIRMKSDQKQALNFRLGMELVQEKFDIDFADNQLIVNGWVDGNDRPFNVRIKVVNTGGEVVGNNKELEIKNADEVVILLAIATDYKQQYPDYKSDVDPSESTRQIIEEASLLGYNQLRERHRNDYRELYSRVELQIEGNTEAEAKPTNERWEAINKGESDPGIKVLAFNLGRYMIISSSRPGTLPANLQGVWNVFRIPPWSGNYQSNINLQQIYWSCGPTGLIECQEPYIDWIEDLAISGREIAARVYGTEGWVSHTTGNIWGHAAPIGGMSWGLYPMGSAWHCHHLWEQYSFNQDKEYLREVAYPLLKDAAIFYLQNLRNYENSLVFAPSVSAEHGVYNNEGTLTGVSSSAALGDIKQEDILFNLPAPSQDAQMIWDLFTNTLEAGKILDIDADFLEILREKRDSLPSLQVGQYGQLKEWDWEIVDTNNRHRHISHLYAVSPGRQINPLSDIDLAQAAKIALNMRGDGRFLDDDPASGGNWSIAHRMWAWVRLLDGERANDILDLMLTEQGFENLLTYQHDAYHWERRDLDNVGDSLYLHFQLDGSASVPGLIAEMLLQSHHDGIHLLPALPKELHTGSVKGLRARGGYTVNLDWADGKLTRATIASQDESIPEILLSGTKVDHEKDKRIHLIFP